MSLRCSSSEGKSSHHENKQTAKDIYLAKSRYVPGKGWVDQYSATGSKSIFIN